MDYRRPTPRDLRLANQSAVLRTIYFAQPVTRLEVSRRLGISPATVTHVVNDLLERGILLESGLRRAAGGRPSAELAVNPAYGSLVGLEVGETAIHAALFDLGFTPLARCTRPLAAAGRIEASQVAAQMSAAVEDLLTQAQRAADAVLGVGIGFPGLVDPLQGVSVFTANWGWRDAPIADLLRAGLPRAARDRPVYLDNGAKAMAVAEMLFGAGREVDDLAVLLVGTGVGSGIITGRRLYRGASNNAGEIGHTSIDPAGPQCACGSRGCLEAYLGANALLRRWAAYAGGEPLSAADGGPDGQVDRLRALLAAAQAGDLPAVRTLDEAVHALGVGLANLVNGYNPELILLGGWSGLLIGERYLPDALAVVERYALRPSLARTRIQLSRLGAGAVTLGAAALVLEHFFAGGGEAHGLVVGGRPADH